MALVAQRNQTYMTGHPGQIVRMRGTRYIPNGQQPDVRESIPPGICLGAGHGVYFPCKYTTKLNVSNAFVGLQHRYSNFVLKGRCFLCSLAI